MVAFVTDGNSHGIGVNIETDKRDDESIDLFFFFVGKPKLIPKLEKFCLIGRKVVIVLVVKLHVAQVGKRAVVVDITFEVLDSLNIQHNPADQRDESQIDVIGSRQPKQSHLSTCWRPSNATTCFSCHRGAIEMLW